MIQSIIVAVLFLLAVLYIGRMIYRRFSVKKQCGGSCNCGIDLSSFPAQPDKQL